MTYLEFLRKCQMEGIPLADIRDVFSCFPYSFDSIGIHGEEEAPKEAEDILIQLKQGYPAAYIAGFTMARGVKIYLDESTLIPRNETLQFLEYRHGILIHFLFVDSQSAHNGGVTTQPDVVHDTALECLVQLLMHHCNAVIQSLPAALEVNFFAFQIDVSAILAVNAEKTFHQRGLAGTVFAH